MIMPIIPTQPRRSHASAGMTGTASQSKPAPASVLVVGASHIGAEFVSFLAAGVPALLLLCVYPLLWVRTEHNAPFPIAFRWMSLPCLAAAYGIVRTGLPRLRELPSRRAATALAAVPLAFLLTLLSAGPVIYANMIVPPQERVRVEGVVAEKHQVGSRYPTWVLSLETTGGKVVKIPVSSPLWHAIRVGDGYLEDMTRGGLGFLYRRRW